MQKPDIPYNEEERTRAIQNLGMIYSPSEARFDRITRLVCRHFDIDTALVTIVYKEIQWFKSLQGLNACSTDREVSFCGHAILTDEPLIVENALLDPRFMDNPLVVDSPRIRFYAGQPIKDAFGIPLGTLCLIDSVPRAFSAEDKRDLRDFARLVEAEVAKPVEDTVVSRFIQKLSENQRSLLIDPIVGSWNRRGFEALLDKEMENAARLGEELSLIHVKLSSFDVIMSRFGHDRVVDFSKFTASIIRDILPNGSSVGSLGADAFVAVCSGMKVSEVVRLIEELKVRFAETTLETHGVKALVDVEIRFLTLNGDGLKRTAVAAVDQLLSLD
ncbi:GGDEF domain-containing protein [Limnobacter parvus]|uniref:Diguanylate cyclase n=1 Tax=Limnobacter parvus TaxID=2939690 RepID=A0ABT1XJ90_9BURK|nr:GAF domain-containing protein [Limnobacter parvus]MCR2746956.1 diguanylate cyclase [Limnobacter parvus]